MQVGRKYVIKREAQQWSNEHVYLVRTGTRPQAFRYTSKLSEATMYDTQHDALVYVVQAGMDADGTFMGDRIGIATVRCEEIY